MDKTIRIALAGNPNSGKTSLFNRLTGARQHVGNYPGVTVEKRDGSLEHKGRELLVTDLPGTYSLTAYSVEEEVARNFIVAERPNLVVNVVDATNLERNLYFTVQVMELGVPLVIALNMSDAAASKGIEFDLVRLSRLLGAPVVPTVAVTGAGTAELLDAVVETAAKGMQDRPAIGYGREVDEARADLAAMLAPHGNRLGANPDWTALKLLEDDEGIAAAVADPAVLAAAEQHARHIEVRTGDVAENVIAEARYRFISKVCGGSVRSPHGRRRSVSDRIDAVVTHRVLALPLFLGMMYLVFQLTFTVGGPLMDLIDAGFGILGESVSGWWPEDSESPLKSLLVDGVIAGAGGVIVFLPNILLLFLAIALLEDTGYMARAAFIMERLMHRAGLHGKSFIPMLIGFGCSIPAIMATRTLENQRDRLTTILVTPLMSCGARLPIYALIIPAFFPPALHAPVLWAVYLTGIALAILCAWLLRATLFKGETQPFVMELPPYRMPAPRNVLIHMWERGWLYLKKAGTVILAISIVLWAMTSYPKKDSFEHDYAAETARLEQEGKTEDAAVLAGKQQSEELAYSVVGRLGRLMEPVLSPMGFDWKIGTALVGAFAAKEVFVAQLGIVYSVSAADEDSDALRDRLRERYSTLQAFCIMLFCLISTPCMATLAVTKRETNSWKWALFQFCGLTLLGYVVTVAVYQLGSLAGIGV